MAPNNTNVYHYEHSKNPYISPAPYNDMFYTEFVIPKKNGKARKICAPSKDLLKYQRKQLNALVQYYKQQVRGTRAFNVAHGFIPHRSVVSAAVQHVGYKCTIMMDISNFFDTVTSSMIPQQCQDKYYFHKDSYCAQGFATSPMLANIATIGMLDKIYLVLENIFKDDFVFTIYADDIQISLQTENKKVIREVISKVSNVVQEEGFSINVPKTRVKYSKYGFRRILGINVGEESIRATRKTMRKIRAARHCSNKSSLGGLTNWSKCREPVTIEENSKRKVERRSLFEDNSFLKSKKKSDADLLNDMSKIIDKQ